MASRLIEAGEQKSLERLLTDLRACSLPQDFSSTLINHLITLTRRGIGNLPTIPFELQSFDSITEFKNVKNVVTATIYNALIEAERRKEKEKEEKEGEK